MAEAAIPRARFEVRPQSRNASRNHILIEKREARHSCSHPGIEIRLRAAPKGCKESIDVVVRNGDVMDIAIPKILHDFVNGRTPPAVEFSDLWKIGFSQPEVAERAARW